jgi:hypothetical protein
MIKVALVNSQGEIVTIVSPSMDDMYLDGSVYADLTAVHIPQDTDTNNAMDGWFWRDGAWDESKPARPSEFHYWEDFAWHLDSGQLWIDVRQMRDAKISWSDYTLLSDAPISDSKREEWVIYRQALRDVPENNVGVTDIADIVWPTAPN